MLQGTLFEHALVETIVPNPETPVKARMNQVAVFNSTVPDITDTPRSVETAVAKLAAELTDPAESELEKARAIYRWITKNIAYDVQGFHSGNHGDLSPAGVLTSRKTVCMGYANLFEALAEAAGLEAGILIGWCKGYGFTIGVFDETFLHAWNAVKINNQWRLVDTTWGAGYIEGHSFIPRFTEYYFLTPPGQKQ